MSLPGEALFAVTGVRHRGPVVASHGERARALPEAWHRKLVGFLNGKTADFEMPGEVDPISTWKYLATAPSDREQSERLAAITDEILRTNYLTTWQLAADYLRSHWPHATIETPVGPKEFPPSPLQALQARSLYRAVNRPIALLDEMVQGVLTSETVDALKAVYPGLTEMVRGMVRDEFTDRLDRSRSWEPTHRQDQLLRVLFEIPQGTQIVAGEMPDGEPKEPAPRPEVPELEYADKLRTKVQELEAR